MKKPTKTYPRDTWPCPKRGWHDATKPVCDCGGRWGAVTTLTDGSKLYTDLKTRQRFIALYGEPRPGFLDIVDASAPPLDSETQRIKARAARVQP